jgi:RNA polymerase sigma factor (sigma-70 family)
LAEPGTGSSDNGLPKELAALFDARSASGRAAAWSTFLDRYSRLLLHAVRTHSRDYDDAMDRYAFVLEQLQERDHARLHRFAANGRGRFTTWLVVVARRLSDDYHRRRYGRLRAGNGSRGERARERHETRRRLVDMVTEELKIDMSPAPKRLDPEMTVRRQELTGALAGALGELDTTDRLILKLRFEEDYSVREIAEFLSLPSQFHVYRRLKATLGRVRRRLTGAGIMDSQP